MYIKKWQMKTSFDSPPSGYCPLCCEHQKSNPGRAEPASQNCWVHRWEKTSCGSSDAGPRPTCWWMRSSMNRWEHFWLLSHTWAQVKREASPHLTRRVLPQISIPLSTAFGVDTEGAQWIVGYLLEKVVNNLSVWSAEVELSNDTVELLVTLVEKRERWGLSGFLSCGRFL